MFDPIEELRKGNINVFNKLTYSDKKVCIKLLDKEPDKKEIIKKNFYKLMEISDAFDRELLEIMYKDKDLFEYTVYLLNYKISPKYLTIEILIGILKETTWGFDYIIKNLDELSTKEKFLTLVNEIINYVKDDKDRLNLFLEFMLSISNKNILANFILTNYGKIDLIDKNYIIKSLYKNKDEYLYHQMNLPFYSEQLETIVSSLPSKMLMASKFHHEYNDIVMNNAEIFINAEKEEKMKLIEFLKECKEIDMFLKKYDFLLKIYQNTLEVYKEQIDNILSIIINHKRFQFLLDFFDNNNINYINCGTTTYVYKIGDYVLKLTNKKHDEKAEKNLFLIAPTDEEVIYDDDNNVLVVIEIQKYLSKSCDGLKVCEKDIKNWLDELDRQGYETTDPNNLSCCNDNFGFLNDYHDAILGNYESYEDLPDWFKERPIVLYDIDLLYKKEEKEKKYF